MQRLQGIEGLPLVPTMFELIGIFFSTWFVYRYLLFKPDRCARAQRQSAEDGAGFACAALWLGADAPARALVQRGAEAHAGRAEVQDPAVSEPAGRLAAAQRRPQTLALARRV